jgi:hypothetical protein
MHALLPLLLLAAAPQGGWSQDYGACLKRAAAEKRPLLVVLERPAAAVRPAAVKRNAEDSATLENYVLCRVDATTKYGQELAQKFDASELPFTAIIDRNGERQIYRHAGQLSDSDWRTTLATYRQGTAPVRPASTLTKLRFESYSPQYNWQPMRGSCPNCR